MYMYMQDLWTVYGVKYVTHMYALVNEQLSFNSSVLTRILRRGVPGPPLLRNRGPARTLGGQSYSTHGPRLVWKQFFLISLPSISFQISCFLFIPTRQVDAGVLS